MDNLTRSPIRENEVQDLLKEKELAYKSLMEKHLRIVKKCRDLKESVTTWRLYHDKQVAESKRDVSFNQNKSEGRIDDVLNDARPSAPLKSVPCSSTNGSCPSSLLEMGIDGTALAGMTSIPLTSKLAPKSSGLSSNHNQALGADVSDVHVHEDQDPTLAISDHSTQSLSSPVNTKNQQDVMATGRPASAGRDESDSPVLISERSLKRKRPTKEVPVVYQGYENGQTPTSDRRGPINVKSEAGSSPVLYSNYRSLDFPHDSIDLDEIGARSFTPRKQKRTSATLFSLMGLPSNPRDDLLSDEQDEESLRKTKAMCDQLGHDYSRRLWEEHRHGIAKQMQKQRTITGQDILHANGNQNSRLARQQLHNQKIIRRHQRLTQTDSNAPALHNPCANQIHRQVSAEPCETSILESTNNKLDSSDAHVADILQPKNPNALLLPRAGYLATSKLQRRRRRDDEIVKVSYVAEDGEFDQPQVDGPIDTALPERVSTSDERQRSSTAEEVHRRLGGLLAEPSPEKPILDAPSMATPVDKPTNNVQQNTKETVTGKNIVEKDLATSGGRNNIPQFAITPEQASSRAPFTSAQSSDTSIPMLHQKSSSKKQPLRNRPIDQLTLDDFRVNALVNGGFDYAFNEPVRKRDQRKCLPNCTKPDCCGDKFHKLVKIGGLPLPQRRGLWDTSPTDEADKDYGVLRDHFGLATDFLNKMNHKQKRQMLLRAEAERAADTYGKHRKLHERPPTPPGFWRTEMPTTQEEEMDKAAAEEMERQKVEERYIQAMKENGLWKFRDE